MEEDDFILGKPRPESKIEKHKRLAAQKLEKSLDVVSFVKKRFVSRLFWGRSSAYKYIAHILVISLSLITIVSGIVSNFRTQESRVFLVGDDFIGQDDLLQQGSSINTVIVRDPQGGSTQTTRHIVRPGETLEEIASQYELRPDTIRWASRDVMNPLTNRIEVGWQLTIPELDGVLYQVRPGQTIEEIVDETSSTNEEANLFNIAEYNNLKAPYDLTNIEVLFIPEGNLIPSDETSLPQIPRGVLTNPLSHPSCNGYIISRGFLSYHNGVDLALFRGCPIRAVANGVVEYAGWGNMGQGHYVRIRHEGGLKTEYFHGNGEFWVQSGDFVTQDQEIMQMGNTGNSTGPHVHFILWKDGVAVNPAPFVPY